MKWIAEIKDPSSRRFVIENVTLCNETEDRDIPGFYLYIYENNICTHDYLQDTLEIAMDVALEDYNVPKDSWEIIE